MDINMFAKFDEILTMTSRYLRKQNVTDRRTHAWTM